MSTSFPSEFRKFPQGGLTFEQMLNCIRSMGELDVEAIKIQGADDETVPCAASAYLHAGIPLIVLLKLVKSDRDDFHAAVITGYKANKDEEIIELYVHDDGIGPYNHVEPDGTFKKWKNEWNNRGYEVFPEYLIVPVYHKVRLPFTRIFPDYKQLKKEILESEYKDDMKLQIFLTTVQKYKKFLLNQKFNSKLRILKKLFPRFLWIARYRYKGKIFQDSIFDGTSIYPRILDVVEYL